MYQHLLLALSVSAFAIPCPPLGPLLPQPKLIQDSKCVQNATTSLTSILNELTRGEIPGGVSTENVSFSVAVVGLNDPRPFWEYHWVAPTNDRGTNNSNGSTQWMIGSVSKVFTDLIMLRTGIDQTSPITKFIPELDDDKSRTDWSHITIGSLASHLAGITPTFGFPEIYPLVPQWEALGFPPLTPTNFPECGIEGLNKGCTKQQLLSGLKFHKHPVNHPNTRASYSSISFTLLSYALQAYTNKTFPQLLQDEIIGPLNLNSTSSEPPSVPVYNAVIPRIQPNSWGADYLDNSPGGGLRSSPNDLLRLLHAILTRTAHPNRDVVNQWLQPSALGSARNTLVGKPWEIFRIGGLIPSPASPSKQGHTENGGEEGYTREIVVHAKDGAALGYFTRVGLIDELGIGIVLLTAGEKSPKGMNAIWDAVLAMLLPSVETATREEAVESGYTGKFRVDPESTKGPLDQRVPGAQFGNELGSIEIAMDAGPGLKVLNFNRNGSDILAAIEAVWELQFVKPGELNKEWRIYPMDISRDATLIRKNKETISVIEDDWRVVIGPGPEQDDLGDNSSIRGLPHTQQQPWQKGQSACYTWQSFDTIYYGGEPLDRIVFIKERETGKVIGIESPALRMNLNKT